MNDIAGHADPLPAATVAAALRARLTPAPGDVKLHKLLYYAQGWHLARTGRPLFPEAVEAWTDGPVVAELRHDGRRRRGRPGPRPPTGEQAATVDYVAARYGDLTALELVRRTHDEDPWRHASEAGADDGGSDHPEIDHAALRRWFEQDDDYLARAAVVARLRASGVWSLDPEVVTDDLVAAVARTVGDGPP